MPPSVFQGPFDRFVEDCAGAFGIRISRGWRKGRREIHWTKLAAEAIIYGA